MNRFSKAVPFGILLTAFLPLVSLAASHQEGPPAQAIVPEENFYVNSTDDVPDANLKDEECATAKGDCTLRAAIDQNNAQQTTPHLIHLKAGSYNLGTSLEIKKDTMITGEGAKETAIDGNDSVIVFNVAQGANFSLSKVTIQNGHALEFPGGAGIANHGNLDASEVVVQNNKADYGAGGILTYYGGTTTMRDSTISNNRGGSGGIETFSSGAMILTNVTISGNLSWIDGGGISVAFGDAKLINCTVVGNQGPKPRVGHTLSEGGGGIYSYGDVELVNTLMAQNTNGNCAAEQFDLQDHFSWSGRNMVDDSSGCPPLPPGNEAAPLPLGSLAAYNGEETPTHALLPGNPAIGAGQAEDCPPRDQRGVLRHKNEGHCDIGAYEYRSLTEGSELGTSMAPLGQAMVHAGALSDTTTVLAVKKQPPRRSITGAWGKLIQARLLGTNLPIAGGTEARIVTPAPTSIAIPSIRHCPQGYAESSDPQLVNQCPQNYPGMQGGNVYAPVESAYCKHLPQSQGQVCPRPLLTTWLDSNTYECLGSYSYDCITGFQAEDLPLSPNVGGYRCVRSKLPCPDSQAKRQDINNDVCCTVYKIIGSRSPVSP